MIGFVPSADGSELFQSHKFVERMTYDEMVLSVNDVDPNSVARLRDVMQLWVQVVKFFRIDELEWMRNGCQEGDRKRILLLMSELISFGESLESMVESSKGSKEEKRIILDAITNILRPIQDDYQDETSDLQETDEEKAVLDSIFCG